MAWVKPGGRFPTGGFNTGTASRGVTDTPRGGTNLPGGYVNPVVTTVVPPGPPVIRPPRVGGPVGVPSVGPSVGPVVQPGLAAQVPQAGPQATAAAHRAMVRDFLDSVLGGGQGRSAMNAAPPVASFSTAPWERLKRRRPVDHY